MTTAPPPTRLGLAAAAALRWQRLRAAMTDASSFRSWMIDANDGIIATASLLQGFAGAGASDRLLLLAAGFGMVSGYAGLVTSYAAGSSLPAGPSIILAAGAIYIGSLLFGSQDGLARRLLPRAHLQR